MKAFLENWIVRWIAGLFAAVFAIAIIYLSLTTVDGVLAPEISDKIKHFVAYFALSAPFLIAAGPRRLWPVILVCVLLGISLEFAQYYGENGREGSVMDAVANAGGALFGAAITSLFFKAKYRDS